jgi:lysophospholipase L1-like esterase
VTCTATDARTPPQTATCSFSVTLVPFVPVLRATKFLAFGDSITAGENGEDPQVLFRDPDNAYPAQLRALLRARYTGQSITVDTSGVGTETASGGARRIGLVLDQFRPEVVLLLEGINSLNGNFSADVVEVIQALREDILAAKSRGLTGVFLSTLIPENPNPGNPSGRHCVFRAHDIEEVGLMNNAIRGLAAEQGVVLVDSAAAFAGHLSEYIDCDGLHPTPAGNLAMAQAFFSAIQATLEAPAQTTTRRRAR